MSDITKPAESGPPVSRGTLGLTGLTVNAMALIAPGAFLWLTFQIQALYGAPMAGSAMWFGIVAALLALFRDGHQLRRAVEAVSGRGLVVLLRGAGVPVEDEGVQVRPDGQVHHRVGQPPLLLGVPGLHGRRDRAPQRLSAQPVLARHVQRRLQQPPLHVHLLHRLRARRRVHRLPRSHGVDGCLRRDQRHPDHRPAGLHGDGPRVPRAASGRVARLPARERDADRLRGGARASRRRRQAQGR